MTQLFPTRYKHKVPKTLSYCLGATEVSEALADVPQAELVTLCFHRDFSSDGLRPGIATKYAVLRAEYRYRRLGISSSQEQIARGEYDPKWQIDVYEVTREHRHALRTLLDSEGLPRMKRWLEAQ